MLLIIIGMLPNSSKLLSMFSLKEVVKIMPIVIPIKIAIPNCDGVLASFSTIFGMRIDNEATSQSPGMMKMAKLLNQKISAGANIRVILNHQYSGLDAASKPYLGNN